MTTSLELSKRLWEKGLRIETLLYNYGTKMPRYSTDELLEVLLNDFKLVKHRNYFIVKPDSLEDSLERRLVSIDKIPAEALGLMVEYLLDNGWVYDSEKKGLVKI